MNTRKNKVMSLSIVIPAYNEKNNIDITIDELLRFINTIPDINDFQVLVVDDHSSDDTYDIVCQIKNPRIICLRLSRRSGSFTALRAGYAEAKGDAVLCISADGQDDHFCLINMLQKLRNGANVVWALRKNRRNEPPYIRIPAQLFYRLLNWFGSGKDSMIDLSRADFCLLDKVAVEAINACPEKNTSLFGLIAWLGFKQDFVEYERRERRYGNSKWNFKSRLHFAKDWIIAFSGIPLKIASTLGILTALLGILYAVFIIMNKLLFNVPVQGWTSLVVLILVLGGMQLTILGIIGEYLWRTIDETRKRPLFFIEKRSDKYEA